MKRRSRALAAVVISAVLAAMLTPQAAAASAPLEVADDAPGNALPDSVHAAPEERITPEPREPQAVPPDTALGQRLEELQKLEAEQIAEVDANDSELRVEASTIEGSVEDLAPGSVPLIPDASQPGEEIPPPIDESEYSPATPAPTTAPPSPSSSPTAAVSGLTMPYTFGATAHGSPAGIPLVAHQAAVPAAIPTGNACFPGDAPTHNATVDVHGVTQTIMHNRQGRIKVTVTNTGSTAWPAGTQLSYRLFDSNQNQVGGYGANTPLDSMASNTWKIVEAAVGPVSPGSWYVLWDINVPGTGWLGQLGICPLTTLTVANQRPSVALVTPRLADVISTRTPYLTVNGSDVDAWPAPSNLRYEFRVYSNVELTANCVTSGQVTENSWRVPELALQWSQTYFWNATVSDGAANISLREGTDPQFLRFQIVVPQPDTWRQVGNGVGMSNVHGVVLPHGVFLHTERDANLNAPNLPLYLERTFSSGATGTEGVFGKGWLSALDASAVRNPSTGNITVTYPDGRQEVFGLSGSQYIGARHLGIQNDLVRNADGSVRVTQANGELVSFDASGKLLKIEHPGTGAWEISYSGGNPTAIVQRPSGMQIALTWSRSGTGCAESVRPTKPYVTSSRVSRGGGSPDAVWQYLYSCDRLYRVSDPGGGSTWYSGTGTSFSASSPEGRGIPGVSSIGSWRAIGTSHRERSLTITQPGSANRVIRILAPPTTGSTSLYRESYNEYGGLTALYCETRSVTNGVEDCSGYYDTLRFDNSGRLRYKSKQGEGASLNNVPYKYWYYDASGRLASIEDENHNLQEFSYDAYGNLSSSRRYRNDPQVSQVTSQNFYRNLSSNPSSPLTRLAGVHVSPDSSGTYLGEYDDMFRYDALGRLLSREGPATPGAPGGEDVSYTYTTGTEPAVGGSGALIAGKKMPVGLLRTETTAAGVTTFSYDDQGNTTETHDRTGVTTLRAYDARGLVTFERKRGDSMWAERRFSYDAMGRMTREERPCAVNELTNADSRLVIEYSFDRDGLLISGTHRAVDCDDSTVNVAPPRKTSYEYTNQGQLKLTTAPSGGTTKYTYASEDPTLLIGVEDARGRLTSYTYNREGRLRQVIADIGMKGSGQRAWLTEYGYDAAGRIDYEYDALSRTTYYDYTGDDLAYRAQRPVGVAPNGASILATMWERQFDGAGRIISEAVGNRTTRSVYDSEGRLYSSTLDPSGLRRTTTTSRDSAGRVVEVRLSDGSRTEKVTYDVDAAGLPVSTHVWLDGSNALTTITQRTEDGLVLATRDPRFGQPGSGPNDFSTHTYYDDEGRQVGSSTPWVTVDRPVNPTRTDASAFNGVSSTTTNAWSATGYNAFGDVTEARDELGRTSHYEYDTAGRLVVERSPAVTNADGSRFEPVIRYEYNAAGDLTRGSTPMAA